MGSGMLCTCKVVLNNNGFCNFGIAIKFGIILEMLHLSVDISIILYYVVFVCPLYEKTQIFLLKFGIIIGLTIGWRCWLDETLVMPH